MTLSVPSLDERKLQSETVAFRVENFFGEKYELARVQKWHQTRPCSLNLASISVKLNKKVRLGVLHRIQKEKYAYQSAPASESTFSGLFQGWWLLEEQRRRPLGVHPVARPARARDFSRARDSVPYVAHIAPDSRPRTPLTSRPAPAASALSAPARPLLRDFYSRSPPPPHPVCSTTPQIPGRNSVRNRSEAAARENQRIENKRKA